MKNEVDTSKRSAGSIPSQVLLGLGVIGLGVLFLLDNLGYIEFRHAWHYWPALVVAFGVVKLLDAQSPHERFTFGVITAIGTLLLLNRLGLTFFSIRIFWPLVLIMVGALVVYKAVAGRRAIGMVAATDSHADSVVDITAILGGVERRISSSTFRGGEITAVMGGCELDLRGASIEGDAVLNVFAVMGGITIKCPPDWTVILQGTPIMGGFDEKTATPPDNAKRLVIKGYAIMGGVEIRN